MTTPILTIGQLSLAASAAANVSSGEAAIAAASVAQGQNDDRFIMARPATIEERALIKPGIQSGVDRKLGQAPRLSDDASMNDLKEEIARLKAETAYLNARTAQMNARTAQMKARTAQMNANCDAMEEMLKRRGELAKLLRDKPDDESVGSKALNLDFIARYPELGSVDDLDDANSVSARSMEPVDGWRMCYMFFCLGLDPLLNFDLSCYDILRRLERTRSNDITFLKRVQTAFLNAGKIGRTTFILAIHMLGSSITEERAEAALILLESGAIDCTAVLEMVNSSDPLKNANDFRSAVEKYHAEPFLRHPYHQLPLGERAAIHRVLGSQLFFSDISFTTFDLYVKSFGMGESALCAIMIFWKRPSKETAYKFIEELAKNNPNFTPDLMSRVGVALFFSQASPWRHGEATDAFLANIHPGSSREEIEAALDLFEGGIAISGSAFEQYLRRGCSVAAVKRRAAELRRGTGTFGSPDDPVEIAALVEAIDRPIVKFQNVQFIMRNAHVVARNEAVFGAAAQITFRATRQSVAAHQTVNQGMLNEHLRKFQMLMDINYVVERVRRLICDDGRMIQSRSGDAAIKSDEINAENVIEFVGRLLNAQSEKPAGEELLIIRRLHSKEAKELIKTVKEVQGARISALLARKEVFKEFYERAAAELRSKYGARRAASLIEFLSDIPDEIFEQYAGPLIRLSTSESNHVGDVVHKYVAELREDMKKKARGKTGEKKAVKRSSPSSDDKDPLNYIERLFDSATEFPDKTRMELICAWALHQEWAGEMRKTLYEVKKLRADDIYRLTVEFAEFYDELLADAAFRGSAAPRSTEEMSRQMSKAAEEIKMVDIVEDDRPVKAGIILVPVSNPLGLFCGHIAENCLAKEDVYALHIMSDADFVPYLIVSDGEPAGMVMTYTREVKAKAGGTAKILIVTGIDPTLHIKPSEFMRGLARGFEKVAQRGEYDLVVVPAEEGMQTRKRGALGPEIRDMCSAPFTVQDGIGFPRRGLGEDDDAFYHGTKQTDYFIMFDRRRGRRPADRITWRI